MTRGTPDFLLAGWRDRDGQPVMLAGSMAKLDLTVEYRQPRSRLDSVNALCERIETGRPEGVLTCRLPGFSYGTGGAGGSHLDALRAVANEVTLRALGGGLDDDLHVPPFALKLVQALDERDALHRQVYLLREQVRRLEAQLSEVTT